jgi:hypothetical protein
MDYDLAIVLADGTVLDLDDAYELGRRATRWCVG